MQNGHTQRPPQRAHYLQLHFDVLYSPEIRLLPAAWRCALLDILAYAVRSDEPGIITIAPAQLCKLCGMRNYERFQEFLLLMEERRVIAFRKDDDAIVVNPSLIPQVPARAAGDLFPRRRSPSEQPEALRIRKQKSRQAALPLEMDAAPPTAPRPAECHDPESEMSRHSIGEHKKEQQQHQPTRSNTPENSEPVPEIDVVDVVASSATPDAPDPTVHAQLTTLGITSRVAAELLRVHGPEICRLQILYLPYRNCKTKSGTLVRAITEQWTPPADYHAAQARRNTPSDAQRHKHEQEATTRRGAQASADSAAKLNQARQQLTAAQAEQLHKDAIATLNPTIRKAMDARGQKAPIVAAAIAAAETAILTQWSANP